MLFICAFRQLCERTTVHSHSLTVLALIQQYRLNVNAGDGDRSEHSENECERCCVVSVYILSE